MHKLEFNSLVNENIFNKRLLENVMPIILTLSKGKKIIVKQTTSLRITQTHRKISLNLGIYLFIYLLL